MQKRMDSEQRRLPRDEQRNEQRVELKKDNLRELLVCKLREIECVLKDVRKNLEKAPQGYVRAAKCGNSIQFFHRTNPKDFTGKYIRKEKHALAQALVQKEYDLKLMDELVREQRALQRMVEEYHPDRISEIYYDVHPYKRSFVTPRWIEDKTFICDWLNVEYEGKDFRDEDVSEFFTANGERVRSKSEVLIADALHRAGVPYRYEYPHCLMDGRIVYPDFTCLNPFSRREFIWEHFGLMGEEDYVTGFVWKMDHYVKNGFFPGCNLLMTFEHQTIPLSSRSIEMLIKKFLTDDLW